MINFLSEMKRQNPPLGGALYDGLPFRPQDYFTLAGNPEDTHNQN